MKKRFLSIVLTLGLVVSLAACSKSNKGTDNNGSSSSKYDTLVIGTQTLNGIFNPLFANSAYDIQVSDNMFAYVSVLNENNEVTDWAGSVSAEEIQAADGHAQVKYTVKIKDNLKFTDGEAVTIDDVLFYYYVTSDPSYDGSSIMSTLDIVGLKEYYYDTPNYTEQLNTISAEAEKVTDEEVNQYIEDYSDIDINEYGAEFLNDYFAFGVDTSASDFETQVRNAYIELNKKDWDSFVEEAKAAKLETLKKEFVTGNLADGIDVEEISGITRVDDYTCTILFDSININGDREIGIVPIMPEHYYGKDFVKGDVSTIKAYNGAPLGCGPYIFQNYENNVVSLAANETYFQGAPKIAKVKFQVVSEADKIDTVIGGNIDITDPSASLEAVQMLDDAGIEYSLVDNPGYGYIAINAASVPSQDVRKGLMHLMNRAPAVEAYFGELAEVIERPMTPTLAEYPTDATEYYGYSPEKALEYFTAAGYSKNTAGKLVDENGQQLKITVGIGGEGTMNHPSAPILTQMANDMEAMGAELIIRDLAFADLTNMKDSGELDMWCLAWGNSNNCDLTQIFGSKGNDNDVHLYSDELDSILGQVVQTLDLEERTALVSKELDLIMDAAVYMPIYQRKNMLIYNPETVNTATLPENTTTYWDYTKQIHLLEMN